MENNELFNKTFFNIFEAYLNNYINKNEKDICIDIITEKVEWKRNMNKILRKYNFNPNDNTIIVDGNRYKINLSRDKNIGTGNYNSYAPKRDSNGKVVPDVTKAKSEYININLNDMRLLNDRDIDTVISHEVGHAKINEDMDSHSGTTVKSKRKDSNYNMINSNNQIVHPYKTAHIDGIDKQRECMSKKISAKVKKGKPLSDLEKALYTRRKFTNIVGPIVGTNKKISKHVSTSESEADRFAADKVGSEQVKSTLNKMYKNMKREESDKLEKYIKKEIHGDGAPSISKIYNKSKSSENIKDDINRAKQNLILKRNLKNSNSDISKELKYRQKIISSIYDDDKNRRIAAINAVDKSKINTKDFTQYKTGNETNPINKSKNPGSIKK